MSVRQLIYCPYVIFFQCLIRKERTEGCMYAEIKLEGRLVLTAEEACLVHLLA